jgi:hypothetical protein
VPQKSGSVFALGMRVVRLAQNGAPLVGADNAYETDNLVRVDFTMQYREGEEKERVNGAGRACLYYKAPDTVRGLTVDAVELCYPEPELEEFLSAGDVLVNAQSEAIGYAAPEVGTVVGGNGVALELWSSAITDDGVADEYPYMKWLLPREKLRETGTRSIGADPLAVSYEGTGQQNPNYGSGPFDDWLYESSRVFQWYYVATMPTLANGLVAVPPVVP